MTNSKTERYKIAKVIEDYPSKWKVLLKWAVIQIKIGHYTDIQLNLSEIMLLKFTVVIQPAQFHSSTSI